MASRRGKGGSSERFPLLWLQNHCGQWLQPWDQKMIASWQESDEKPRKYIESRDITLPKKGLHSQITCRVHHKKCWAGWSTSWNQDCWEKYQQPQVCRWHHPYGRKWRRTKKPLDESEREEWKKNGLQLNIQKTKIMASGPITSWQIDGETVETVADFTFLGSKITADGDCSHEIKTFTPWKKSYDQPSQHIKKLRHYFANKGPSSQGYHFSSSHVWMWELDYKESWGPKNWCSWTVVLEKILESPLDSKEIQLVHPKWNQSWIFIGRTDVEAETPILWPPAAKNWLIWKDSDAGKDWRWEEKGTTDDEMVGWHHGLNGHEFE